MIHLNIDMRLTDDEIILLLVRRCLRRFSRKEEIKAYLMGLESDPNAWVSALRSEIADHGHSVGKVQKLENQRGTKMWTRIEKMVTSIEPVSQAIKIGKGHDA
jgi:hypothetical protein